MAHAPTYPFPVPVGSALRAVTPNLDPYTLVVERLWQILENDPEFAQLVPDSNRIKFAPEHGRKPRAVSSDAPEVRIWPQSSTPNARADSHHFADSIVWAVQMAMSEPTLSPRFFALRWVCLRVFCQALVNMRSAVLFEGRPFIVRAEPQGVVDSLGDTEDRPNAGWVSVFAVVTDLSFPVNFLGSSP